MAREVPSVAFVVSALGAGAVIAILAGTVALIGVLFSIVKVQGDRIGDARVDLNRQIETITGRIDQLDASVDRRVEDATQRLEQAIESAAAELRASIEHSSVEISGSVAALVERIDGLNTRLDRVEGDLRGTRS